MKYSINNILTEDICAHDAINKYCEQNACFLAKKIDDNMAIVINHKPKLMPVFLYKLIIKKLISIINVHK